jgi:DNA-binding response OmpR family regulator
MAKDFLIHIVDDDPLIQASLEAMLEDDYSLELIDSAEACLERIEDRRPGLILLDVTLPGMNGYELCKILKERTETKNIWISFVSAHDTLDARLAGYEAGGDDFIVKPFDVVEVKRKVAVTERHCKDEARSIEQTQSAEQLTELLMASMNDYMALISYLGKLAGVSTATEVAEATLTLLQNNAVEGVVQVRLKSGDLTMKKEGIALPLETSIMNHVRTMERVFEFKKRSVFNFDLITIMINNMPLHDSEACGRIRDNMAIAAQGADARLSGIQAESENLAKQAGIRDLLLRVAQSVSAIKTQQQTDQLEAADIAFRMQEDMAKSFVHLGLTTTQEHYLEDLVRGYANRLLEVMDRGVQTQQILERMNTDLQGLSG